MAAFGCLFELMIIGLPMDIDRLDKILAAILVIDPTLKQLRHILDMYGLEYRSAERAYVRVRFFRKKFHRSIEIHLDEEKYLT